MNIQRALEEEIRVASNSNWISVGSKVIVAVGSRGIPYYQTVIQKLIELLKGRGASVSILPAMGSHRRGTAEGQVQTLEEMGITSVTVHAPIVRTMHEI